MGWRVVFVRQEVGSLWGGFDADQLHVSCGESSVGG